MIYLELTVFWLALLVGWLLTLFSLPGNWVILASAALFAWIAPQAEPDSRWWLVLGLAGMATVAEIIEFAAGAVGAAKVGGSRRSAVLALAGSMVGALAGAVIGVPIPIVGPVLGAILFASAGALGGAVLGETWKGRSLDASWKVGQAAFFGRMMGTLAKAAVGSAMVAIAGIAGLSWAF